MNGDEGYKRQHGGRSVGRHNSGSKSRSNSNNKNHSGNPNGNQNRRRRNHHASKSKSRSPVRESSSDSFSRRSNKSRSPTGPRRNYAKSKSRSPTRTPRPPAMTVVINRCDLWDSAAHFSPDENSHSQHHPCPHEVTQYSFGGPPPQGPVQITRVPHCFTKANLPQPDTLALDVIDTSIPSPHPSIEKYWAQRRRLFRRFDAGIQLDTEGWYSVTPEIIADHVAQRAVESCKKGMVLLDAFCGCGGNSIAFGKRHDIAQVVCVDTDRSKLEKAAHNASLYDIPKEKLIFVECNSAFLLQYCYKNGTFVLDQPTCSLPPYLPPPVMPTTTSGYRIGGLDMLPRHIDAVFMDPPWGGVDYEVLGKNGYDLQKNMKIQVSPPEETYEADGDGVGDDFFDSFAGPPKSQKARKAQFNQKTDGVYMDGMQLLKVAAEATSSHLVMYDLPRNTSKTSLGKCALGAGYRGNIKLEEHYLNGRLKTVTAYMGTDYSHLIRSEEEA